MNYELTINELLNYLSSDHKERINLDAFTDISNVILNFHNEVNELNNSKYVCNASMGHGKSTVITSYLKWITQQEQKQPILLCVREKQLAHEIYTSVSTIAPDSIINVTAENKEFVEQDLFKYQIIIIQHERLKNMALGFGNKYNYTYYGRKENKVRRKLIIDERPIFTDSVTFDIGKSDNVLEWFDDLTESVTIGVRSIQKFKSLIVYLVSSQLADNMTDITYSLNDSDIVPEKAVNDLKKFLSTLKNHEDNKNKYTSLNCLKHFEKLLDQDGYGRIDDYEYGKIGRKIIVSNYIDYSSIGMNLLVFDGTADMTIELYKKGSYKTLKVQNRNDYTRLDLNQDILSTTVYARNKNGYSTQKTISYRINNQLKLFHDVFVLPTKKEVEKYYEFGAISDEQIHLYRDDERTNTKGLNLLNTTGKNCLGNVKHLYLTSLPKRNAEYYKELAIAMYGIEVSLLTSQESDNDDWFADDKLNNVYIYEMYAELLQIIHRTALRNINGRDRISIYIAFDDSKMDRFNYKYRSVLYDINNLYMKNEANIPAAFKLYNHVDYGRDKKLDGFLDIIKSMDIDKPIPISKVNKSFKRFMDNHYNDKRSIIDFFLNESGYEIIEVKDRYSNKSRYIKRV